MRRRLTDEEKRSRAEQRARLRGMLRRLAVWDTLLSGLASAGLLVWLAIYIREGNLQGALASTGFWAGLVVGAALLVYLVRKFIVSAKVARKS